MTRQVRDVIRKMVSLQQKVNFRTLTVSYVIARTI